MKKILLCFVIISAGIFAQSKLDTLVVLTYNIHHGEGIDSTVNLQRFADLLKKYHVDIAAFQEVDKGVERTNGIDIMREISALTEMDYYFDKNISYQGGEYGNAIITKLPVLEKSNLHYKMIREGEQRGLLRVVTKFNDFQFAFADTHIDFRGDDSERVLNVGEIKNTAKKYSSMPLIVCGDFNDTPNSRTHNLMKEDFIDVWEAVGNGEGLSYSTEKPKKRIDYIFLKNPDNGEISFKPVSIEVLHSDASDHLPVLAKFLLIQK